MLMQLSHISNVRGNRQAKLSRKEADGQELADASQSGAISLNVVQSASLQEVLEYNTIRNMLSRRDFHRRNLASQHDMSVEVVGVRGLFDP
jgi:hypothetical protein